MTDELRRKVVQRIARQVATFDGYTWQQCPNVQQQKREARYRTLAESILATVERGAAGKIVWARDVGA
jgi:hypothetical protein